MRLGAWKYLQWKHVTPITRDGKIVAAKLIVYAGEPERYFTFISGEAYEALNEWMETRKRGGEKIYQDTFLMRDVFAWTYGFGAANPNNETITYTQLKKC
jgi:hypothetical protein